MGLFGSNVLWFERTKVSNREEGGGGLTSHLNPAAGDADKFQKLTKE